jgi:hypothetical protein
MEQERVEKRYALGADQTWICTNISDLVRSLHIPVLWERFDKIEDASNGTFDWIFGDPDLNLAHWLRSETGIYWIRGKPGSGKSTLMKYLHNHPKTSELLKTWKPGRLQIDAWFFFDVRGSHIQRSLEGVLHSILHRLVSSHSGLADKILPIYTARVPARRNEWPLSDLQQALMLLLDQEDVHVDLHLFLDALDEYGDPPEIIADFVADLADRPASSWTKTKVFFSSRLWTIFLDRFGQAPGFFIHEHTKGDIRRFVRRMISEHGLLEGSAAHEEQHNAAKLCSDICERAEGVFLWVKLVSTELVKARHGGASIAELRRFISKFSLELDHYYAEIVNQIPESRRFDTFVMLEVVVRSQRQLSIEEFMGALQCAPCQTIDECLAVLAEQSLELTSPEKTTRLIRDYAGGLLELVRLRGSWIVQFMHQTVKDFISTPGFMHRLLGPELNEIFENGHSFLAKFRIAWAVSKNSGWAISASENALLAMFHAGRSESTTGISQRRFLNSLTDDVVELGFRKFLEINSRLSFAVIADLRLYVREELTEIDVVNNNPSISLLYCLTSCTAVLCDPEGAFAPSDLLANPFGIPREVFVSIPWELLSDLDLSEMCRMLLDFGAHIHTRPGTVELNSGPLGQVTSFQSLFFPRLPPQAQGCSSSPGSRAVARILLEHGQDPNEIFSFQKRLPGVPDCRPLHLSDRGLSALLLQYGAYVNALDSSERTPLDIAVSPDTSNPQVFEKAYDVYDRIMLLLDHGGQITKHGEKHLEDCVEWLKEGQRHSASRGRLEKWSLHRLERIPRLDLDFQSQPAPPDLPSSGKRRWKSRLPQATTSSSLQAEAVERSNRPVGTPRILMHGTHAGESGKHKAIIQQRSTSLRART